MSVNKFKNLTFIGKIQYVVVWYILTTIRFILDLTQSKHPVQFIFNSMCDPIKNWIGHKIHTDMTWIATYTFIKVCGIFLFAPFLFVTRIVLSILWIASRFGKIPAFVYSVTGIAFIFATWKTVDWMIEAYMDSPKEV